jgi:5-methylcytosine-specific restriction endonuclease McrA
MAMKKSAREAAFARQALKVKELRDSYSPKQSIPMLTGVRYREYLISREWALKRLSIFKKRGRRCESCGVTQHLTLHHLRYERLGAERDDDLVVLCWPCHQKRHQLLR